MRGSAWKSWVAWIPHGKRLSSSFLQGLGGWDAIPFLRSCRGTRRTRTLRFSLLRCGERPGRHPDVASGRYSYPAPARLGASCGGAVSSVVTSGCPKRSEGGCPCRNEDEHRPSYSERKRRTRRPHHLDTDGAFYLRDELLSNAEVSQQERVIPRNFTPTRIPARSTTVTAGHVNLQQRHRRGRVNLLT